MWRVEALGGYMLRVGLTPVPLITRLDPRTHEAALPTGL